MNISHGTLGKHCQQLSVLFALTNDAAANHYLWVDRSGEVHLDARGTTVPSNAVFYCEAFIAGNGYVGKEASKDMQAIENHVKHLKGWWNYCAQNPGSDPYFADYPPPVQG